MRQWWRKRDINDYPFCGIMLAGHPEDEVQHLHDHLHEKKGPCTLSFDDEGFTGHCPLLHMLGLKCPTGDQPDTPDYDTYVTV